jgi:hypothetical protein
MDAAMDASHPTLTQESLEIVGTLAHESMVLRPQKPNRWWRLDPLSRGPAGDTPATPGPA